MPNTKIKLSEYIHNKIVQTNLTELDLKMYDRVEKIKATLSYNIY